ncbi:hypothetical protein HYPSUDRAFT_68700 [Hypholoma sublateritium FD-334 SS-4]|uniref:CxC5 like cysteine cluster associated with KDZ domain-containing protein n=1 Tax=Hypholoma sublateritium (strain FD-334 SS-4) TaxID=945553 RepID=A0A0D2L059_HYPSF|nr:hypothetical protein HYPSUDRAFT_68700 [Hypholoma sublateritium FD-334 SS-4]
MLIHDDYMKFKQFGWDRGLTAYTIYPPNNICVNSKCTNGRILKKAKSRRIVVYTLDKGVQPAWAVTLYCPDCNSTYHNNFVVQDKYRTYYHGLPHYIEVGEHRYIEDRLAKMWINHMLVAWVSATNLGKLYEMSLAQHDYLNDTDWQFITWLSTAQVWDSFVIYSLLDDKRQAHEQLQVPHDGIQADCFKNAMKERNEHIVLYGQPDVVNHACDKCVRIYEKDGELCECQAIIGDGVSIGRPCCGVFACTKNLENNRHRFCGDHYDKHSECAIKRCDAPISAPTSKTCADQEHKKIEQKYIEKGTSIFLFKECSQKWQDNKNHAEESSADPNDVDLCDDLEWYEVNQQGNIYVEAQQNRGTVGVDDDSMEPEKCPEKPAAGNWVFKAQFGRRRTSDEQFLIRPCGVIYACATMYGTEAVSNVLCFTQNTFSVPGARKPTHIFYDSNCLAHQQAESNPWFQDIGMYVDLLDEDGKWYFNSSAAEQHNAWFGQYLPICRDMLPEKYDFFLDEMCRLQNVETLKVNDKRGYNVRTIQD